MKRRTILLLVLTGILALTLSACRRKTPVPPPATSEPAATLEATAQATDEPTLAPSVTPPPSPMAGTISPTPSATETPVGPTAPALLSPVDEAAGSVFELLWVWERALEDDEWFEVQIWPDRPDEQPRVYDWVQEPRRRVTSTTLLPGRYRWRIVVVDGKGQRPRRGALAL